MLVSDGTIQPKTALKERHPQFRHGWREAVIKLRCAALFPWDRRGSMVGRIRRLREVRATAWRRRLELTRSTQPRQSRRVGTERQRWRRRPAGSRYRRRRRPRTLSDAEPYSVVAMAAHRGRLGCRVPFSAD